MTDFSLSNSQMPKLVLSTKEECLDVVLEFVESILKANGCSIEMQITIAVAVEEIYVNIASYAYAPEDGEVIICCEVEQVPTRHVIIEFCDCGRPYNPLSREEPDITMSAEDRQIGGLGIFIVKNTMDEITYHYEDQKNIMTIKKNF